MSGWAIKGNNCGDDDFFSTELDWTQFHHRNSGEMTDLAQHALNRGDSLGLEFDSIGRDGIHDPNVVFCVMDDIDITRLIARLARCRGNHV